jgi:hypothetical protein
MLLFGAVAVALGTAASARNVLDFLDAFLAFV